MVRTRRFHGTDWRAWCAQVYLPKQGVTQTATERGPPPAVGLCRHYALSGTDIGHTTCRHPPGPAPPLRQVLRAAIGLRACDAVRGADMACGAPSGLRGHPDQEMAVVQVDLDLQ